MKASSWRAGKPALISALLFSLLFSLTSGPSQARRLAKSMMARPGVSAPAQDNSHTKFKTQDSGQLAVLDPSGKVIGKCPLKHTSVKTDISGYVARVNVKQTFHNPFKKKIEAIYTFPLSESGAVDSMLMKVGNRIIKGQIKKREDARKIYDRAKAAGHVASLLDQERPNIFTQSVANIEPGQQIEITLTYVDLLPYEAGSFSFAFPTVVGPRFNPGQPTGKQGTGWSQDTTLVPDASKITPPVTPKGTRAGHDISLEVTIDAGVPIKRIKSKLHEVTITRADQNKAKVVLTKKKAIPNRDFILSWDVASDKLQSGYLTHKNGKSGYFTLMLLPPKKVTSQTAAPKEMIFIIDCSGSQSGRPLQKAKETMNYMLDRLNPNDSFQIITFNNRVSKLFDRPRKVSLPMKAQAKLFINQLQARGGTWMAPAVEEACAIPADQNRLRIVSFMTDGYIGNDFQVIGLVKKLRGTSRWYPFGTGNSVNRMLIDGMAKEGGGEAEYVLLNDDGEKVAKRFFNRISSPVLTDIKVKFNGVTVKEVFPKEVSDVWAEKPLYIKGRYETPGKGFVELKAFHQGKPYVQKLGITLPARNPDNKVLGSVWARAKVDRLMSEDWFGAQRGSVNKELKEEIIRTALSHHIMTQYTSFVAVEEKIVTKGGKATRVTVPVEMPDGVSRKGVFGEGNDERELSVAQAYSGRAFRSRAKGKSLNYAQAPTLAGAGNFSGGASYQASALPAAPLPAAKSSSRGLSIADRLVKGIPIARSNFESRTKQEEALRTQYKPKKSDRDSFLSAKIDRRLKTVAQRLAKLGRTATTTINGIRVVNGRITVHVWLKQNTRTILEKLKKAGLQIKTQSRKGTMVVGTIEIANLNSLAGITAVRRITPAGSFR